MHIIRNACFAILVAIAAFGVSLGQAKERELMLDSIKTVEIRNLAGRVTIASSVSPDGSVPVGFLSASSDKAVADSEIKMERKGDRMSIAVSPLSSTKRIDVSITLPAKLDLSVETGEGAVTIDGEFSNVRVLTETGTIAANVPKDDLTYNFRWLEARPRIVSDITLKDVKELSGGRFQVKGKHKSEIIPTSKARSAESGADKKDEVRAVGLDFTTGRGIVLLNVPPSEVGSDLRERPLTNAAKAIVRSGDSLLMEAIRRAAPKYFGEYTRSLPPIKLEPRLKQREAVTEKVGSVKRASVRVTDLENRSVNGLRAADFEVSESGESREILSVERSTASFNLILLLDVSGSIENYVNFLRKTAKSFVDTVDEGDRVSLVTFNEDVKVISDFTKDKGLLSERLDTFDAGGGTAYYDALAFAVADTLRPIKGERSAIVILTDGDDNRSFLAFDSLIGSIQESGALIYPLYVPSGLIAEATAGSSGDIDPLRKKYMSLSAKSSGEGERLAKISGGVYYPITEIGQLQKAYSDIVLQLRSSYDVTYRSSTSEGGVSPRLRIKVKQPNTFASIQDSKVVKE